MKKVTTIFGAILFASSILTNCSSGTSDKKVNATDSVNTVKTESKQSSSEPISKKKEVIFLLIGEHSLKSITGSMGANALVDYTLENGKWTAYGSSISEGNRERYDIDLSKNDLQKLNTMKINVGEDLSVSLSCEGTVYFNAPYKDDGMTYLLKKSPKDYNSVLPEKLQASTTFLDDYLYFYAKDKIAEADLKFADFVGAMADAVVLKHNQKTNEFELVVFYGDCCDNSTFIFY